MKLLIAIPVFNEAEDAPTVLDAVLATGHDVLVVDDGSTDGTPDRLPAHPHLTVLRHGTNKGYGQSLIDAFNHAADRGYDWVLTMDADGQHEPEQIAVFERAIREHPTADLISGSRYVHVAADDDLPPAERRSVNAAITRMINGLFGWHLTDAFCGFKAHRVVSVQRLKLDEAGYAFPLQLWPRVWAGRQHVIEVPVRRIYNHADRTFGGKLDDVRQRVKHYTAVFQRETATMDLESAAVQRAVHRAEVDAVAPHANAQAASVSCCSR